MNPNGFATTAWFEYGTSSGSLTQKTPVQNPGSGSTVKPFSASISGLAAGTKYYYRAVGQNGGGTTQGTILSFTTQSSGGGSSGPFPHNVGNSWNYRTTTTGDGSFYYETDVVTESTSTGFTIGIMYPPSSSYESYIFTAWCGPGAIPRGACAST